MNQQEPTFELTSLTPAPAGMRAIYLADAQPGWYSEPILALAVRNEWHDDGPERRLFDPEVVGVGFREGGTLLHPAEPDHGFIRYALAGEPDPTAEELAVARRQRENQRAYRAEHGRR